MSAVPGTGVSGVAGTVVLNSEVDRIKRLQTLAHGGENTHVGRTFLKGVTLTRA